VGCCAAPRKGACSAPASSAHGEGDKPTTVVGWAWVRAARRQWLCGHGGARRGAASAAAMERKAGGRRSGEEGVWRGGVRLWRCAAVTGGEQRKWIGTNRPDSLWNVGVH
jgi:hypothetical protein